MSKCTWQEISIIREVTFAYYTPNISRLNKPHQYPVIMNITKSFDFHQNSHIQNEF